MTDELRAVLSAATGVDPMELRNHKVDKGDGTHIVENGKGQVIHVPKGRVDAERAALKNAPKSKPAPAPAAE